MNGKHFATPAIAGLLVLPIAGYAAWYLMQESPFAWRLDRQSDEGPAQPGEIAAVEPETAEARVETDLSLGKAKTEADMTAGAPTLQAPYPPAADANRLVSPTCHRNAPLRGSYASRRSVEFTISSAPNVPSTMSGVLYEARPWPRSTFQRSLPVRLSRARR